MKIKDCNLIEPFICHEEECLVDVAKKLREITLRHIFVVKKDMTPVGIISVLDINNRAVAEGKSCCEVKAKDIMTSPIEVIDLEEEVKEVAGKMIKTNHAMEAVVEDGKMTGIVTIQEILKRIGEEE